MKTGSPPLTRRHALGLIGSTLVTFSIPRSEAKAAGLTADEAFRFIEEWDGASLNTEEIQWIFLATWPTMHRHGYNIKELPGGQKLSAFYGRRHMSHLLLSIKNRCSNDLVYAGLDLPLMRVTGVSGINACMWWAYTAWMKRSIIRCFETDIDDLRITRERFSLYGLFCNYQLKPCP
ncbi:MAG: hypothetical protein NTV93_18670 [Verrucomicrobia bacterium]|nr:hypothetical protein [Verrucomicrobiota bacterium]